MEMRMFGRTGLELSDLGLVIAKSVHGQLASDVPARDIANIACQSGTPVRISM